MFRCVRGMSAGIAIALAGAILMSVPVMAQSGQDGSTVVSRVMPVAGDDALRLGWNSGSVAGNSSVLSSTGATTRASEAIPSAAPLPSAFWSTMVTLGGLGAIWGVRRLVRKTV